MARNAAVKMAVNGKSVMRDLIFVSLENWDDIWRRNQFLCAGLATRFPDKKLLFCGPPRSVAQLLRRGDFTGLRHQKTRAVPGLPNIHVMHPLQPLPNSLPGARRINEFAMRFQVRAQAKKLGIKQPILWLNPHDAVHMAGRMNERAVIYDITDDWILAANSERERALIEAQDAALCRAADLVIVCSHALEQSRQAQSRNIFLLPNGVDVEHYKNVAQPASRESAWPAPVLGYTGSLHSARVDVDLVIALARAFPQGTVALVGPDSLNARARGLLEKQRNIRLPGAVSYACIPETMARFDVCIVPHVESSFTESLNPIKLWEYLASGKPVVSTNVAGFRDYAHLCHIATGAENFIAACRKALQEAASGDDNGKSARLAEAAGNSWELRIDCLLDELKHQGITS